MDTLHGIACDILANAGRMRRDIHRFAADHGSTRHDPGGEEKERNGKVIGRITSERSAGKCRSRAEQPKRIGYLQRVGPTENRRGG